MSRIILLSASILVIFTQLACKDGSIKSTKYLNFSIAENLPVPEPSGIDMNIDETSFWIVSDENSKVYLIDSWGKELKNFTVNGKDLEGITVIDTSRIAVILERSREVVILDTSGKEINRFQLNLKGELNSGLEGITYDPAEKIFYVLNEKSPKLLLTFDEDFNELRRDTLNFSKDVSGIYFSAADKILWILSDESQKIIKTDLMGERIEEFKIKIIQPEGITLNSKGTRLYIVSDRTNSLYVFKLHE